ncbi:MoaD/ThiS family protein [Psychrobacter sp. M13]|uniref:MoaD/ThiS family protein n=1 Tax=Psychrobacter sp. M13 TaxID=3067275 RepID=UPI001917DA7D|nr:MoaD/ThiS family protein [Psychrobacter sp. M13]WLP95478.1 MoaD/ThiS family protein [Psychrobacter sp. M13]
MLITYTDNTIADNTMTIDVLYFADVTDKKDYSEERVKIEQAASLTDLYKQLSQNHIFSHPQSKLRVAINDDFVNWNELIYDGDNVAFILPVISPVACS